MKTKNLVCQCVTPTALKKIIQTTQAFEGYKPATVEVIQKVQQLRQQYGVQVSYRADAKNLKYTLDKVKT